jgi:hypothetical protein
MLFGPFAVNREKMVQLYIVVDVLRSYTYKISRLLSYKCDIFLFADKVLISTTFLCGHNQWATRLIGSRD